MPSPRTITLTLALLLPVHASAEYRELCTSAPGACVYTGPDAPRLDATVCHGSAGTHLRGAACPTGTWAYTLAYGELVDPLSNAVAAYVPLDDACANPQLCLDGPPPPDAQPYPMCCTGNTSGGDSTCVHGVGCGGTIWFCIDGVSNDDGTVTCFNQVELS